MSPQTWWRVPARYGTEVVAVTVERETPKFLVIKCSNGTTRREAKCSEWNEHYPTQDEALNAILRRLERNVRRATEDLNNARQELEKFRASLVTSHPKGNEPPVCEWCSGTGTERRETVGERACQHCGGDGNLSG